VVQESTQSWDIIWDPTLLLHRDNKDICIYDMQIKKFTMSTVKVTNNDWMHPNKIYLLSRQGKNNMQSHQ